MMDAIMILSLGACFGVLRLFVKWCQSQIEPKK